MIYLKILDGGQGSPSCVDLTLLYRKDKNLTIKSHEKEGDMANHHKDQEALELHEQSCKNLETAATQFLRQYGFGANGEKHDKKCRPRLDAMYRAVRCPIGSGKNR